MKKNIKLLSVLSTVLFTTAVILSGWPCLFIFNQPKAPEGLKKFRKF
jgi:cyclic lactone autoinducer peptide